MKRKLTDEERENLNAQNNANIVRKKILKNELRDNGKEIRDEIKKLERSIDDVAGILLSGEIEESDQMELPE